MSTEGVRPPSILRSRRVWSWALYDFANTIYSAVVVTLCLPLYLTSLMGRAAPLGIAGTLSMVVAGFSAPWIGYRADRLSAVKRILLVVIYLCFLFTIALSFPVSPWFLILFFALANVSYQISLSLYNALLPVVGRAETIGRISGLGVALGYAGVVVSLPTAMILSDCVGIDAVFVMAAVLFFLFSLPLIVCVPEVPVREKGRTGSFFRSLKEILRTPSLLLFFLGSFFVFDAMNTAIVWLSKFMEQVHDLSFKQIVLVIVGLNLSAALAGWVWGVSSDRFKASRVLVLSVVLLCLTLAGGALLRSTPLFVGLLFLLGGPSFAGIWTSGRKVLLEMTPPEKTGEYFGIYGMAGKVSAFGMTAFSLIADHVGYPQALGLEVFVALGGLLLIAGGLTKKSLTL